MRVPKCPLLPWRPVESSTVDPWVVVPVGYSARCANDAIASLVDGICASDRLHTNSTQSILASAPALAFNEEFCRVKLMRPNGNFASGHLHAFFNATRNCCEVFCTSLSSSILWIDGLIFRTRQPESLIHVALHVWPSSRCGLACVAQQLWPSRCGPAGVASKCM